VCNDKRAAYDFMLNLGVISLLALLLFCAGSSHIVLYSHSTDESIGYATDPYNATKSQGR